MAEDTGGGHRGRRHRLSFADPLVVAVGLVLSWPLLCVALWLADRNTLLSFAVVLLGQLCLNLNWAVISDMLLYVVVPTRRGLATSVQILFSHALGDAGSPYEVGQVADALQPYFSNATADATLAATSVNATITSSVHATIPGLHEVTATPDHAKAAHVLALVVPPMPEPDSVAGYRALEASLLLTALALLLAAAFFFACCATVDADRTRAARAARGDDEDSAARQPVMEDDVFVS